MYSQTTKILHFSLKPEKNRFMQRGVKIVKYKYFLKHAMVKMKKYMRK